MKSINKSKIAVILCGGKGLRMGGLTKRKPKPLLIVHGKPIIWYSLSILLKYKFNKIIFPLGYRGKQIKKYILLNFKNIKKNLNLLIQVSIHQYHKEFIRLKNIYLKKKTLLLSIVILSLNLT